MSTGTDPLLSPREVAKVLEVSSKTVTRWAREGWLPADEVTLGGHRRWRRSTVEAARARAIEGSTEADEQWRERRRPSA